MMDCDYFVIVLSPRLRHSKVILTLLNDQHLCAMFPIHNLITLREVLRMGLENQSFSFFPFGALFCLMDLIY